MIKANSFRSVTTLKTVAITMPTRVNSINRLNILNPGFQIVVNEFFLINRKNPIGFKVFDLSYDFGYHDQAPNYRRR